VLDIPPAIAAARRQVPGLRCAILGEGPQTEAVRALTRELGLEGAVDVRGRVGADEVERTIASACCLLNPSEREGYGLVVVEAAARGTPTIVVAGAENAATELIEPGVNGFVAGSRAAGELASLIVAAVRERDRLGRSTLAWYERNREQLSIDRSLELVVASYAREAPAPSGSSPAQVEPR
jgi:glycosyltransferase involved in cell wall biosynthesis